MADKIDDRLRGFLYRLDQFNEECPLDEDHLAVRALGMFGDTPAIDELERMVSYFKARRDFIANVQIPELLAEYGLKKVTMDDGTTVETVPVLNTKTLDNEKMIAWINSIGAQDLIKDNIALGKGLFDEKLRAFLAEGKYSYTLDSSVHGQTLKKAISDRFKLMGTEGLPPADAVQCTPFTTAQVKKPKDGGF